MRFHLDRDDGAVISGWVAPDNPTHTPRVIVHAPDQEAVEIAAHVLRADILDHGLHSTGLVGFEVNESHVAGIERAEVVEIFEAETKLCIYRRFSPKKHIEKKLFLFDASIMPQSRLISGINRNFALHHNFIERYAYETILSLIHGQLSKSIFLTGRPLLPRYVGGLRNMDFCVAAMLRNPFEELAERLLFLGLAGRSTSPALLANFMTGLEPALEFARDLQLNDVRALQAAFRRLTPEVRAALANPLTRMLAGQLDERIERRHVSVALENLAQLDMVGARSHFADFGRIAHDVLGADIIGDAEFENFQATAAATEALGRVSAVIDLLEHDLALYSFAEEAVETGLTTAPAD